MGRTALARRLVVTLRILRSGLVTADEIGRVTGTSRRNVYRDIQRLRTRGHRIAGQSGIGLLLRPQRREDRRYG